MDDVAPDRVLRVVSDVGMNTSCAVSSTTVSQSPFSPFSRALALGCVLSVVGVACDRGGSAQSESAVAEAPAAAQSAPVAPAAGPAGADQAPAPMAAPTAPAGKASYDEEGFQLSLEATGPFTVGKPAEARVVLHAKGGFKVNDQYPFKLTLVEQPGLEFPAKVVTRDAMTIEKKQGVMKVAFSPKSAGDHALSGRFSFSVCTEERCLIEKRDLLLTVSAK